MGRTFTQLAYHIVFGTKNRTPLFSPEINKILWPYLGGLARENDMTAYEVGGHSDHVHLLLRIPPAIAVSKGVQIIKGASSFWIKKRFPAMNGFEWQDGYGAFSVSRSQEAIVRRYIQNQYEHHRVKTFEEEYRGVLKKHGIEFQERHLFD